MTTFAARKGLKVLVDHAMASHDQKMAALRMAMVANTPLSDLIAELQPVKYEKLCLSCWMDQIFSYLGCLGLSLASSISDSQSIFFVVLQILLIFVCVLRICQGPKTRVRWHAFLPIVPVTCGAST